jgi:large subunit ribosomal protein L21
MYAIIRTGGKQYKVSEGDILKVEKLDAEVGSEITFDDVLAVSDGDLKAGDEVKGATVKAEVLEQGRFKKVIVMRYKPKTGYHKKNGHRQPFTKVRITKVSA